MNVNHQHPSEAAKLRLPQQIYFRVIAAFFVTRIENGFLRKKKKYDIPTKCVTKIAGLSIIQAAEAKSDDRFLCELKVVDFIAREVHYHNYCREEYTRLPDRRLHATPESELLAQQKVHIEAFENLKNYVRKASF
ncbi:unnamed protein product [Psylliodes chrysocephalus]|uniref:Uncharacterized protein n=1 Tax=Psylliodes chrysocephalus TaxID=3402493 RepID=A0A9P0GKK5_9CUCU|nr:unnamed protein product [Psylliodes chrysocephala]